MLAPAVKVFEESWHQVKGYLTREWKRDVLRLLRWKAVSPDSSVSCSFASFEYSLNITSASV